MRSRFLPAAAVLTMVAGLCVGTRRRAGPPRAADTGRGAAVLAPVVQRAAPAVVNVYAARTVANRNPMFDDPVFRRFFGVPGMPSDQVQRSLGSGVIVDASGLVVTNNHVIEGADQIKVSLADKREFEAEIVLKDSRSDLAVLRIKDGKEQFPGDRVRRFRRPAGRRPGAGHRQSVLRSARPSPTASSRRWRAPRSASPTISSSSRPMPPSIPAIRAARWWISRGKLVGINTAIFSRSGGSQGIGFAIPANMVRVVVASAKGGGTAVKRPWLGARLQEVTSDIAESLGLKRPAGVLVASVTPGSPAARAGLRTGDLIVADRRPGGRRSQCLRLPPRHQGARRHGEARRACAAARKRCSPSRWRPAPDTARDELVIAGALAVPGRAGVEYFAGARRRAAHRPVDRRRHRGGRRQWFCRAESRLPARRPGALGQ